MIIINNVEKDYYRCNACLSDKNIKQIRYGDSTDQQSIIRLCKKCVELLVWLLEKESEGE